MRAGKPCATGSGVPFMATATRASRPSITVGDRRAGGEAVHGGAQQLVRARLDPAIRSRLARLAPSHLALPMYGPPTGLDTQVSVT